MTEYYNRKFQENKGDIKETWNVTRECISGNKKNENEQIQHDGCDRYDEVRIVNRFGDFFYF